ncbi:FAD-dependent oxidoreductase [Actinoallomurus sp. CA-142502]|uniref:FAD-dependent oxidoreductase n=1 Tax=Actinoallomurus sp. CA-142502 TaxID=3239885 RepID=UPI003D945960
MTVDVTPDWSDVSDPGLRQVLGELVSAAYRVARTRSSRAAHGVGVAAGGRLRVLDDPALPAHRVLDPGAEYRVLLRHSNARGFADDAVLDGRGAALRLLGPAGDTSPLVDLVLVTGERFVSPHAAAFAEWTRATAAGRSALMADDPGIAQALTELIRDPDSYLDVYYYSQVAYRFIGRDGIPRLVRYRLRSADGGPDGGRVDPAHLRLPQDYAPRRDGDPRAGDHLRDEFRRRVRRGDARYLLELQLRPDEGDREALDPTRPWPPERFAWVAAAEVELDHLTDPAAAEMLTFNPGHAPPELALIPATSATDPASVNHVRAVAYRASAHARLGLPIDATLSALVAGRRPVDDLPPPLAGLREALVGATLDMHRLRWQDSADPVADILAVLAGGPLARHEPALARVATGLRAAADAGRPDAGAVPDGFRAMLDRLTAGFHRAEAGSMAALADVLTAYRPVCMETIFWNGVLTCRYYRDHGEYLAYAERVTRVLPALSRLALAVPVGDDQVLAVARFASVDPGTASAVLSEYTCTAVRDGDRWALRAVLETEYLERPVTAEQDADTVVEDYFARPVDQAERHAKLALAVAAGLLVEEWEHALARFDDGPRRVCVIGAGPAGLVAAHELHRRGHRVTVLEQADAVAGKCASVAVDGRWYDLGGHLCIGEHTYVRRLAAEVGAGTEPATPAHVVDAGTGSIVRRRGLLLDTAAIRTYQRLRDAEFPGIGGSGLVDAGRSLDLPAARWATDRNFAALTALVPGYTGSGYGFLGSATLPALYPLRFAEFAGVFSFLGADAESAARHTRWTVAGGFMDLWRRVAARLPDVRVGQRVESVTRADGRVRVRTRDGEEEFDDLVLAMPLDRTGEFLDLGDEERELFARIRYLDYWTVVAEATGLPREGFYLVDRHVDDPATVGHCVSFHHRYPDTDVYTFYGYGRPGQTAGELQRTLAEDVRRMGGRLEAVHTSRRWDYFPHVEASDAAAGFFSRLEGLQGARNTWYAGSLLAFELVEPTAVHARELVRRHFPALAGTPGAEPASAPPPAAPTHAGPLLAGVPDHAEIRDWMRAQVARRLGLAVAEVDADAPLDAYPLESLAIVQLIAEMSAWLDWEIAPAVLVEYPTIDEVARAIADDLAAESALAAGPSRA